MKKTPILELEKNIDLTLDYISRIRKRYKALAEEKKELKALLEEKELRIERLQNELETLKSTKSNQRIEELHANEEKLKEKLQQMMSKLDKFDFLE